MLMRHLMLVMLIAGAPAIGAHAESAIVLTCTGSGSVLGSQVSSGMQYDEKTRRSDRSTNSATTARRFFNGAARVSINGTAVRVNLPRELIPGINRAQGGWFVLEHGAVTDRQITGTLVLNVFNKPRIVIDRLTGQMTLASGAGDFSGNCAKADQATGPRF